MVSGSECEIRVRRCSKEVRGHTEWAYGNTFREGGIVLCILHILM